MDTIYNRDGCFYRALDDEPVFVLLARDPCAAETVRWWVTLRQALIGRGEKPLEDHDTLSAALRDAQAMVEWRADATGPQWLDGPRWKVEIVPERRLVARDVVEAEEARHDATVREMQAEIDRLEEIISSGQQHTVETIKSLLPGSRDKAGRSVTLRNITDNMRRKIVDYQDSRETMDEATGFLLEAFDQYADQIDSLFQPEPSKTTGGHRIDAAKEALWIDMAEERGFLSAEDAANQRSALPPGTTAAIPSKHLTFIGVDLGRKVAVGLRQVATDLTTLTEGRQGGRIQLFLDIADRINGYAAELDNAATSNEEIGRRQTGVSPALGEPYGGGRDPYRDVALDIQIKRLIDDYRRRFPEVVRLWDGPDLGRGQQP